MKNLILYSVLIVAFLFIPNAQAQSNTALLISGPAQIAIGTGGGAGTWIFKVSSVSSQIARVKLIVAWGDGENATVTSTVTSGIATISLSHTYYTKIAQYITVEVRSDDTQNTYLAFGRMPIVITGAPIAPITVSSFSVSSSTVLISPGQSKIIGGIQFLNTVSSNPSLKIRSFSFSCDGCPLRRFDRLFSTLELYKRVDGVDTKIGNMIFSSDKKTAVWNFAVNSSTGVLSSGSIPLTQFVVKANGLNSISSGVLPLQFRLKLSAINITATPSRSIRINGKTLSSFIDVPLEYVTFLTASASVPSSSYAALLESLYAQIEFLKTTLHQLTESR